MIFPIRCFTCNKVIGNLWETYSKRVNEGEKPKEVLDSLNIPRYCCRKNFLGHVEVIDRLIKN